MVNSDPIFSNPKLAAIYDIFDGERNDLIHYLNITKELKAKSILDVGCGTGSFACLLAQIGYEVVGVDPAKASLDIALSKPNANKVQWVCGDTSTLSNLNVDLAIMTGNVAQVFVTDQAWESNIKSIHSVLKPNGYLVFEVRDPVQKAWEDWTPDKTFSYKNVEGIGLVDAFCEVQEVINDVVKFIWTYTFHDENEVLKSESILRFRSKEQIVKSLTENGFTVKDIRDAVDRPGKEFVFIAQRIN